MPEEKKKGLLEWMLFKDPVFSSTFNPPKHSTFNSPSTPRGSGPTTPGVNFYFLFTQILVLSIRFSPCIVEF